MKVKDVTIKGVACEVHLSGDKLDDWTIYARAADVDSQQFSGKSYEEAEGKARLKLGKKVKVEVPFTYLDGENVRQMTATGINDRTHNIIAKDDETGKSEQLESYYSNSFLHRLTDAEAALLSEAIAANKRARAELDRLIKRWNWNVRDAAAAAVKQAIEKDAKQ